MPGRLLEVAAERADWLRDKLRSGVKHLILYAYADQRESAGGLRELAAKARLRLDSPQEAPVVARAAALASDPAYSTEGGSA
jgi:hypothetical protein